MIRRNLSIILLLLSLVVIVAVFILNYRQLVTLIEAFDETEHSHSNVVRLGELQSVLKDIQRAHRGYVISHHPETLVPYDQAVSRVPTLIGELRDAYRAEPGNLAVIDSINSLFQTKIGYAEAAIQLVERHQYDSAVDGIREGKALVDETLHLITRLADHENSRYNIQQNALKGNARRILMIVTVGLLVSGVLLITATGRAYRRRIDRLNSELEAANKDLESTNAALLQANLELKRSNLALEKMNKELDDFSYSVSHDLKAPLRAVRGYCEMMMDEPEAQTNERIRKSARVIADNARRMDMLINDLLKLARLGNTPVTKQRVDMNNLVDEVLRDKTLVPGTQVKVGKMEMANGDARLLKQVWENLISNAIKFTAGSKPPVIEIGSGKNATEQHFWISDNGVGFDPQYGDKLFKVFSRLHSKNEFEGTGAGLAIVKKIIDAHHGRTWAEGRPQNGATFYFSLPASDRFHEMS